MLARIAFGAFAVASVLLVGSVALMMTDVAPPSQVTAATVPNEAICRALNRQAHVMAKAEMREFRRHMVAHRKFQAKEIPFGPVSNPKSVLAIWKDTMHKGKMHAKHYAELHAVLLGRGCLAEV